MALNDTITALGNAIINLVDKKTPIATANTVGMVKPDGSTISIDANGIISSNGGGSGFNLFDTKISDHILNGEEAKGWALQGSYVNGAVYPDFYAKCIEEYNQATATETINGVTVKVHSNGHKFYNIADKTAIDEFFNTIGSAWFYGVDTENERIFLPRDKYFAVKGVASVAGNGVALGLTDGTNSGGLYKSSMTSLSGSAAVLLDKNSYGSAIGQTATQDRTWGAALITTGLTTDPTKSGIEAHLETNEDKYLYICVGNTIVNEDQIDVSKVLSEAVLRSSLEEVQTVIETYKNGTSWYRIWSDGWCEQGGECLMNRSWTNYTLLKPYKDMDYSIFVQFLHGANVNYSTNPACVAKISASEFQTGLYSGQASWYGDWQACGYIW